MLEISHCYGMNFHFTGLNLCIIRKKGGFTMNTALYRFGISLLIYRFFSFFFLDI
jgi:hypothetical protein